MDISISIHEVHREVTGTLILRPYNFIAKVDIDYKAETIHANNTDGCTYISF